MDLFKDMRRKRREWTRNIEKAKKKHWREFLEQASSGDSLWKAAKYAKPTNNYATIPPLKVADMEYTTNDDKARIFLESFFPHRDTETSQQSHRRSNRQELPWKPITEQEIARVLLKAKRNKAPGIDGLPMLVWKNIWNYTSKAIIQIFKASIRLSHYPVR